MLIRLICRIFAMILMVFLFIGGAFSLNAQDLIVLRDGNIIEATVIEFPF